MPILITITKLNFFMIVWLVRSCDPPQWPINGYIRCNKPEILVGTSCTIGCSSGYNLNPQVPRITCVKNQSNANMDSSVPSCQGA